MGKKLIWFLIGLMALAIIGLVIVQSYWILNAVEVKNQQFRQLAYRTLYSIIHEIEKQEVRTLLMSEMRPDVRDSAVYSTGFVNVLNQDFPSLGGASQMEQNKRSFMPRESGIMRPGQELGSAQIVEDGVLNFSLQYIDSLAILPESFFTTFDLTGFSLRSTLSQREIIRKIMHNMTNPNQKIEERINKSFLDSVINREMMNAGINTKYEFAVRNDAGEYVIHSGNFRENSDMLVRRLFPNDIFMRHNYLAVYFPEQKSYIFQSLGFMVSSSILLVLIILGTFAFTIYIIIRQKKLSQIKNDFVNNMTHELKTPISTISLASQMLHDNSIPVEQKNIESISGVILDESKRLGFQVEKVLQMSIFEQGKLSLKLHKINIHDLIGNVVNNFAIQVKNQGGEIIQDLEAQNYELNVDEVHFTNILFNLLDNALKYSKERPFIEIVTRSNKNNFYLIFSDNGIGIRKEDQKRVFEQFYRVPTGNIHNVKGFGLGLSYVKKVIDGHNGSISVESEPKKGTRFVIVLPIKNQNNGRKKD